MSLEQDLSARLRHMLKTARMWGSPEELETAALHLVHVWLRARAPAQSFEQTFEFWKQHGGPFAGDADEHAIMRTRLWRDELERARAQVVAGYASVWASLERHPEREASAGEWIETVLDEPQLAGTPDRLNITLFALMGFVARDPARFVEALNAERLRTGGHELRPLAVVAPPGPTEASITYARNFTTWQQVIDGITALLPALESAASA